MPHILVSPWRLLLISATARLYAALPFWLSTSRKETTAVGWVPTRPEMRRLYTYSVLASSYCLAAIFIGRSVNKKHRVYAEASDLRVAWSISIP